jgi:hypothetical protein
MARNRVIYQSEALYVSSGHNSTGIFDHAQLNRVQSANYNYTINRQNVNQFGQLARIDAIVLEQPTVGVDLTYYLGDGFNEKALGLQVGTNLSGQFGSGHMSSTFTGKNIYILTTDEGVDANNQDATSRATASGFTGASIIGIGNAYLTNYSVDFAVGAIPTVSATFEGLNIMSQTGIGRTAGAIGNIGYTGLSTAGVNATAGTKLSATNVELFYAQPGINSGTTAGNSAPTALRPGDVTITLNSTGSGISDHGHTSFPIQSATITHPFAREDIMKLGSRFATAKVVTFPITATVAIKATLTDIQQRNLADILDANNTQDIQISVRQPGSTTANSIIYKIAACKLDSESFSSSIGSNKSVDLSFSTQIGGANDTSNGIYVSGSCNIDPFNATVSTVAP